MRVACFSVNQHESGWDKPECCAVSPGWQDQAVIHNDAITNAAFETRVDPEAITELLPRITDMPESLVLGVKGVAKPGQTVDLGQTPEDLVIPNQPSVGQSAPSPKPKSTFRRIVRRIVGPTLLTKK